MSDGEAEAVYLALIHHALGAVHALSIIPRAWREAWRERWIDSVQDGQLSEYDGLQSARMMSILSLEEDDKQRAQDAAPARPRRGRGTKGEQWLRRQLKGLEGGPDPAA